MLLRAAWVAPVVSPPVRDGWVVVQHGAIVAFGSGRTAGLPSQLVGDEHDLGDVLLTPGLVNAHTHLELTCYAGRIPPAPFWEWIGNLIPLRAAPDQLERESQGVRAGAEQSLAAGVTCVGDISRCNLHWPVLKKLPLRKVCFVELLTLADHPARNSEELCAGVQAVVEDERLTVGVSPHAPYSVPAEQIRAAIALAAARRRPWTTHWAESPEEIAFLAGSEQALPAWVQRGLERHGIRAPLTDPFVYLDSLTGAVPPGLLAHVNYIDERGIDRLAAAGHYVAYCPRAHRFFGHPPHPFRELLAGGVRVVLATDSAASNEDLSVLKEARFVARNVPDAPSAALLLRMITLDAAAALGLEAAIGSIEVGKRADLAAFPCDLRTGDAVSRLIHEAPPPTRVWIEGVEVVQPAVAG